VPLAVRGTEWAAIVCVENLKTFFLHENVQRSWGKVPDMVYKVKMRTSSRLRNANDQMPGVNKERMYHSQDT